MEVIQKWLIEFIKWVFILVGYLLGISVAGLLFIFTASLVIITIVVAIACACEMWDIYLKPRFGKMRRRKNAERSST